MYVYVRKCAHVCIVMLCVFHICVCVCSSAWVCVCKGGTLVFSELALSLQLKAGFPTEDLGNGLVRALKGCQVHRDSPPLIKPTEDSLII